jgi:flavin-dependent dehydrogenase
VNAANETPGYNYLNKIQEVPMDQVYGADGVRQSVRDMHNANYANKPKQKQGQMVENNENDDIKKFTYKDENNRPSSIAQPQQQRNAKKQQ